MDSWWFHLLTFFFGYLTCRTFYFVNSTRMSVSVMKTSHIIYLSAIVKALEHLSYAREIMLEHMIKTGKGSTEINSFEFRYREEIESLKANSIEVLRIIHPSFFRTMLSFSDWSSAMEYLQQQRTAVLHFWENTNDK